MLVKATWGEVELDPDQVMSTRCNDARPGLVLVQLIDYSELLVYGERWEIAEQVHKRKRNYKSKP